MAEKRKIISKGISTVKPLEAKVENVVEQPEFESQKEIRTKKTCYFCQSKTSPTYTDLVNLRRFLTDRAKILAKSRSSVCSKHQRAVSKNIKYARHLSLLPFVPKV